MKTAPVAVRPKHINVFSLSIVVTLLLLLLPRLLTYFGLPFFVNFLHYPFVLVLYLTTIFSSGRTYDRFLPGLTILFIVISMSALLNGAGVINVFLDFFLLSEPFMILALMTSSLWSQSSASKLRRMILYLMLIHLAFSYIQFLFFATNPDDVRGLFVGMGAGSHVAGAVALTAALYLFVESPPQAIFTRIVVPLLLATIVVIADAKQVILVYGISLGIMAFLGAEYLVTLKFTGAFRLIKFAILPVAAILFILPFAVSPETVERFLSNISLGLENKISVFPILWSFNESVLNAAFGFGPGHSVGRLAEMLPKYWDMLVGLGATRSPITNVIMFADYSYWLSTTTTGTSLFSLRYSWAGIWGDLGVAGIVSYLALWVLVWKRFCLDLLSKFFVCNALVFGTIFSWLEEPGYMGFVAILIGLRWQSLGRRRVEERAVSADRYIHGTTQL